MTGQASPHDVALATLAAFGSKGTDAEQMFLFFVAAIGWHEYATELAETLMPRAERAFAFGAGVTQRLDCRQALDRIVTGELRAEALAALRVAFAQADGANGQKLDRDFVLDVSAQSLPRELDNVARVAIGFAIVIGWEDYRHAARRKPWLTAGINGPLTPAAWMTERAMLLLMDVCGRMWKPAPLHPVIPGGGHCDQVRAAIHQALAIAVEKHERRTLEGDA